MKNRRTRRLSRRRQRGGVNYVDLPNCISHSTYENLVATDPESAKYYNPNAFHKKLNQTSVEGNHSEKKNVVPNAIGTNANKHVASANHLHNNSKNAIRYPPLPNNPAVLPSHNNGVKKL